MLRTWVTRVRVSPSRRAMSAWVLASPEARRPCHSWTFLSSSAIRGGRGTLGGLGLPLGGGRALTTRSAGTRQVRTPMLPFSKAPLRPRVVA